MPDVIDRIDEQRIVPVLRCADAHDAVATARACARGGMRVVELTCSTPGLEHALSALRSDDDLVVGVGTVTNSAQLAAAASGGARYAVSFMAPDRFVSAALAFGLAAVPGALTPTEAARCLDAGATAAKLFPAHGVTAGYLADLRGVVPGLRVMVAGGLRACPFSIGPWLSAGAIAVGLGSDLGSAAVDGADEVERRARAALALLDA